jgi:hypothetical protein
MMQIDSPGCLLDLSVQLTRRGECGTRQTEQLANGRASRGTHKAIAAVAAFCHRNHQFKVQRARFWGYEKSLLAGRVTLVQPRRITIVRRYAISVDATGLMALMKTTVPWPIRLVRKLPRG